MHYNFTHSKKGTITSVRAYFNDNDVDSILINNKWITALREEQLFSEFYNNEDILSIITHALLLKAENKRKIENSVPKYKLGNDIDFISKFITSLNYHRKNTPIEKIASFFEEAKVQDLNDFINNPECVDF